MKLEDLPKKNIYQVPEDYFDKLPGRVMQRVTQDAPVKSTIFAFLQQSYLRPALASVTLLLCFVLIFVFNSKPAVESHDLLASISGKEAMEYLINSEQLQTQDLSLLSQSGKDFSHEFIQVAPEDILEEVELTDLEEHLY